MTHMGRVVRPKLCLCTRGGGGVSRTGGGSTRTVVNAVKDLVSSVE